jgi:hypothetical protein
MSESWSVPRLGQRLDRLIPRWRFWTVTVVWLLVLVPTLTFMIARGFPRDHGSEIIILGIATVGWLASWRYRNQEPAHHALHMLALLMQAMAAVSLMMR